MEALHLLSVVVLVAFQVQARPDPLILDSRKTSKESEPAADQVAGKGQKKEPTVAPSFSDSPTSCYKTAGKCLPWGEICYFGAVNNQDQNDCPNPHTHMCCLQKPFGYI